MLLRRPQGRSEVKAAGEHSKSYAITVRSERTICGDWTRRLEWLCGETIRFRGVIPNRSDVQRDPGRLGLARAASSLVPRGAAALQ